MPKLNVFGNTAAPVGLKKFAETPLTDGDFHNIELKAEHDSVLIVDAKEYDPAVSTKFGSKPAIKADLRVLRADGSIETYSDQLLFGKAVVDQTKPFVGQGPFAAKVSVQKSSYGTDFPKFVEPTDAESEAVEQAFNVAPY